MKQILVALMMMAGVATAAPVVTGSVSSGFVGTSGSVSVCNGVGDLIVVVVSSPDVPGTSLFSTADAGWATEYSKVSRGVALAVFSKVSNGTETSLTVDNVGSVDASATAFCVSGVSGAAVKGAANESALANPPYRAAPSGALVAAVGAWAGGVPAALPSGYGFPIDTGANLSLSFRVLTAVGEDPGPYSIGVVAKWHAATVVIN